MLVRDEAWIPEGMPWSGIIDHARGRSSVNFANQCLARLLEQCAPGKRSAEIDKIAAEVCLSVLQEKTPSSDRIIAAIEFLRARPDLLTRDLRSALEFFRDGGDRRVFARVFGERKGFGFTPEEKSLLAGLRVSSALVLLEYPRGAREAKRACRAAKLDKASATHVVDRNPVVRGSLGSALLDLSKTLLP
jgi:hypothetical protein